MPALSYLLMAMNPKIEKSFDFAADLVKQLITLSTAVIAITITFAKDIIGVASSGNNFLLVSAWVSFFLTILFGVWALMALTGTLEPLSNKSEINPPSIRGLNCTLPITFQILSFLIAIGLTITYAVHAI